MEILGIWLTKTCRRHPDWWMQVAYSRTKLLYQPEPKPVVYLVPVNLKDILGRLALVPYGAHGMTSHEWHLLQRTHFPWGVCNQRDKPGSGSKLFYLNSWAMIWSSDYPRTKLDAEYALWCSKVHIWIHLDLMCIVHLSVNFDFRWLTVHSGTTLWSFLCTLVPQNLITGISQQPIIRFEWTKDHFI